MNIRLGSRLLAIAVSASILPLAIAASPVAAATTRFQLQVPVLYYHHVLCPPADTTDPSLFICPEQFEAQMSYLHDHGWTTITGDQLADLFTSRECPPANVFVVSFDDSPIDHYTNAAPILEKYGMRGTFFAISGVEGGQRLNKMTWDQMKDLVARGHAIGNHTETHANLKKLTAAGLRDQIEGAQQIFAANLGFRPRTFAYPYGRYNDAAIAQVAASGFELAFTVRGGAKESTDSPFLAKRIHVGRTDSGAQVLSYLAPYSQGCKPATPDLSIATSSTGTFTGDNVYSSTVLKSQTVRRTGVKSGRTYRFWIRLDNDAQQASSFSVAPTIGGTANMKLIFKIGGVEVPSIKAGTYVSPVLQPWSSMTIVVVVKPHAGTVGQNTSVVLTTKSVADPARVDVAKIVAAY